jgi:hypothetical protein
MVASAQLRLASDVSPADWAVSRIGPFGSGVGGLLPHGFAAYARILHPAAARPAASERDGGPVRWATVAAWSGRTIHPLVEFDAVARPSDGVAGSSPPFVEPPREGHLIQPDLSALLDVLARQTDRADRSWFCLWDGYGWVQEARNTPRVRLPSRDYLLFEGALAAATDMGWQMTDAFRAPQSPNLFWPDDQRWCVATEIDLDSTFVGGSVALIDGLLADRRLEALPSDLADPVSAGTDEINR